VHLDGTVHEFRSFLESKTACDAAGKSGAYAPYRRLFFS